MYDLINSRDGISVFSRGGTILTDFLGGGAKYEEKKCCVQKTENHYFSINRRGKCLPLPPPNDVPD